MANIAEIPTNSKVIQDLTHRLEKLEFDLRAALGDTIRQKYQRISEKAKGWQYAQRDLDAIQQALAAVQEFTNEMSLLYSDLGEAYLETKASVKSWDQHFREAYALAKALGMELDNQLQTT